ncbi:Lpg1974 family pore-forming outer membrane protein [Legionella sp. 27cVA30]|uniref:Lpg1974 family pore-forming outer membrane protein n=1 Tax=Legionella sp. 27cVA30 TaxID=2905657 RepID=UPI0020A0F3DB|nr:Lpg1974 family pore-forming outer membrane protein [Legionella sp. 27cVA30]MCP0914732.1 Lpg1974 family pore-forming outer membrane protein [Legionella sp. 27cVA30]
MKFNISCMAILFSISATVAAGTTGGACVAGNVATPCVENKWDLGIQALYLQPLYSDSYSYFGSFVDAGGNRLYNPERPRHAWAFNLQGAYHFEAGRDLQLSWYHYDKSYGKQYLTGDTTTPSIDAANFHPRWDAVNLEFGQMLQLHVKKYIRFHGGIQYTQIKITQNNVSTLGEPTMQKDTLKFSGAGPRIGLDLAYDVLPAFAVYAKGGSSLLLGTNKFARSLTVADVTGSATGRQTSLVPELEGSLGMQYAHLFTHGTLELTLGYLWITYFNALQIGHVNEDQIDETSFSPQGPFVGVKWRGGN